MSYSQAFCNCIIENDGTNACSLKLVLAERRHALPSDRLLHKDLLGDDLTLDNWRETPDLQEHVQPEEYKAELPRPFCDI